MLIALILGIIQISFFPFYFSFPFVPEILIAWTIVSALYFNFLAAVRWVLIPALICETVSQLSFGYLSLFFCLTVLTLVWISKFVNLKPKKNLLFFFITVTIIKISFNTYYFIIASNAKVTDLNFVKLYFNFQYLISLILTFLLAITLYFLFSGLERTLSHEKKVIVN